MPSKSQVLQPKSLSMPKVAAGLTLAWPCPPGLVQGPRIEATPSISKQPYPAQERQQCQVSPTRGPQCPPTRCHGSPFSTSSQGEGKERDTEGPP